MNIPPKYEDVVAQLETERARVTDYIAQRAQTELLLDATLGREATLREELESLPGVSIKNCIFEGANGDGSQAFEYETVDGVLKKLTRINLDGWLCYGPIGENHFDALQQRLAVAEQRAGVMEKALTRIAREHDCGCWPCTGSCTSRIALEIAVDAMRDIAISALKPAEEGDQSKSGFTKKTGKSARAPIGLKKDQIVEVFGGGQTQIARVDKTDWRHVEMWRIKPVEEGEGS